MTRPTDAVRPVAWRWRRQGEEHWNCVSKPLPDHLPAFYGITQEPLYAAPVSETPAIPEGWKLVPVEPTLRMLRAGWVNGSFHSDPEKAMRESYDALLAAAPSPSVGDSEEKQR